MKTDTYWVKDYSCDCNGLTLYKSCGSEWFAIGIKRGGTKEKIALKSKEAAEQLHFMLGQMLGGDGK